MGVCVVSNDNGAGGGACLIPATDIMTPTRCWVDKCLFTMCAAMRVELVEQHPAHDCVQPTSSQQSVRRDRTLHTELCALKLVGANVTGTAEPDAYQE